MEKAFCQGREFPCPCGRGNDFFPGRQFVCMQRACLLAVLLLAALAAGCLGEGAAGAIRQGEGARVSITEVDGDWNPGLGCYFTVSGVVYGTGTRIGHDSVAIILVETRTGAIRDTRMIPLASLEQAGSLPFRITLDGECGTSYAVNAEFAGGRTA